jgi:hypothetical protein
MGRFDCILDITYNSNESKKNDNPFLNKPEENNRMFNKKNVLENNDNPFLNNTKKNDRFDVLMSNDFKNNNEKKSKKEFNSNNVFLQKPQSFIDLQKEQKIIQEKVDVNDSELFPSLGGKVKKVKEKEKEKPKLDFKEKAYEGMNYVEPEVEEEYDPTLDPDYISKNVKDDVDVSMFSKKIKKSSSNDDYETDMMCMDNMKDTMKDDDFVDWCNYLDEEHPETIKKYNKHLENKKKLTLL